MRLFVPARLLRRVVSLTLDTTKDPLKAAPGLKYDRHTTTWPRHEVIIGQHLQMEAPKGAPIHASRGNAPRVQSIGVGTDERAHPMSIGAILLIILFIALLGGFAAAHNRHRVLWRRPRIAARDWLLLGGTGRISSLSRSTKAMKCCGTRPRAVTAFSETWRDARPARRRQGHCPSHGHDQDGLFRKRAHPKPGSIPDASFRQVVLPTAFRKVEPRVPRLV
jgi:hypothetical protein